MVDDAIADAIGDLLSSAGPSPEIGKVDRALWDLAVSSGFDRALVSARLGGSGLTLPEARPIFEACGRYAASIPLAEAVLARGIAGACDAGLPDGIVSLALAERVHEEVRARSVPWGREVDYVLVLLPEAQACVFPSDRGRCADSPGLAAAGECDVTWHFADAMQVLAMPSQFDGMVAGAALRCAQIAGALDAILELSQRYVTERRQFGRRLADFQAVQQQMAVLAEDVFATRMAAELACQSEGILPSHTNVAAAKVVASEAASRACSIAHAVHGAIGMTAEYSLHLYTRRLRAWRVQYGSELYWAHRLGNALLASGISTWEFVRTRVSACGGTA